MVRGMPFFSMRPPCSIVGLKVFQVRGIGSYDRSILALRVKSGNNMKRFSFVETQE